jgi:xanthine dehydrogenase small subunit
VTESNPGSIRFLLNGRLVEAAALPTETLLDHLREQQHCRGVKEGCAEGDCGACTVALGELEGAPGQERLSWRAVNACIRFLPSVDGKEVVTAEGLAEADGRLHPVQQALVDHHGSQCGFCTPGFVMSLFVEGLQRGDQAPTRDGLLDALSGNLCRCTGYRPILDAGLAVPDLPPSQRWGRAAATAPERVERLHALQRPEGLALPGYRAPRTLADFAAAYAAQPEALIVAGGTDVGLWVTKQLRQLPPLLSIAEVAELRAVTVGADGGLTIGAAVRLEEAFTALVAAHPALAELARRFASRPIRNAGTLCGNVANGSPIGDAMPALIALGARVRLRLGDATRELALEDFYLGYQKKDLRPGEFVEAVLVPPADPARRFALYKVSKRIDQDISAVCAGLAVTLRDGVVVEARLAYGGMAATPQRARLAEQALIGCAWGTSSGAATAEAAVAALGRDFTPLSDLRASQAYRRAVAGNLLRRFFLEAQAGQAGAPPLRIADLRAVEVSA